MFSGEDTLTAQAKSWVSEVQHPADFCSNLSQNTCREVSSNAEGLDYLGSGVFNCDWSKILQDSGLQGAGLARLGVNHVTLCFSMPILKFPKHLYVLDVSLIWQTWFNLLAPTRAGRYGQNFDHDIFLNVGRYDIIPISIWTLGLGKYRKKYRIQKN